LSALTPPRAFPTNTPVPELDPSTPPPAMPQMQTPPAGPPPPMAPPPVMPPAPNVPGSLVPGLPPMIIDPNATTEEAPVLPVVPPPASTPGVTEAGDRQHTRIILDDLLLHLVDVGGSDLHLSAGIPPTVRVRGDMEPIPGYDALTPAQIKETLYGILTDKQREKFEEALELDLAYSVPGQARFRVNMLNQKQATGAVMRIIPWEIKNLDSLGLPSILGDFAMMPRGLVLVTGPTGSGKSTTLAAIIDKANRTRRGHIMTIEDPIEFIHQPRGCVVNQREVGADTHSFAAALKHVLRQDPDIILVGEMRDLETIGVALTAAETGHLVFGTLHTQSA
jgi:twitching motility protein PilT